MEIDVLVGDITTVEVDAVVTAANSGLAGGGGVDRAVHRAAGRELYEALRPLSPCPTGGAVVTPAFAMTTARWIIHAVGPVWSGSPQDPELLALAYTASLARCDEVGARSVAFPAISTGAYGYPAREAAQVSVAALRSASTAVERCLLVAFDRRTAQLWRDALDA